MLNILVFLALLGGTACAADAQRAIAAKPNILWITSEDHGPHLGCYGDAFATTPNVDALAAKGMIYSHVWSCAPVCAPARTTLISGLFAPSAGAEHMRSMVAYPAGQRMVPQLLRETGYYCSNHSKEDYNLTQPGEVWDASSRKAHWKNRPASQPFFAVFNSNKSHEGKFRNRQTAVHDPVKVRVPAYHPDTPEVRREWAGYYDAVTEADADAGALLKELADAGLAEDTIVFYFADHGSGMPRNKRWPCNSGLQVPLVVFIPDKFKDLRPPDYQPGGKSARLVSFVDFAPTLLSLAGVPPPDSMQGRAFLGRFIAPPPSFLHGFRGRMDERYDLVRSVTDGRYVYLRNYLPHLSQGQHVNAQFNSATTAQWRRLYDEGRLNEAQSIFWKTPKAPEELYDLQTDPDEVRNLVTSPAHQGVLKKLRAVQQEHARKIRDVGFLPEGEIHTRSEGTTPYALGHDDRKYPFERVFSMAELASSLKPDAVPELKQALGDADSAVRYWAALGCLMRGAAAVNGATNDLQRALGDSSPYVRIAAAWALVESGGKADAQKALAVLGEHAPWGKNDVFVSMAALTAIDNLGAKAASLHEAAKTWPATGPAPDGRYTPYVPNLLKSILVKFGDAKPKKKKKV